MKPILDTSGLSGIMPEISRFFGIVVTMYHDDHGPPHFHARYGGQVVRVAIESLTVLNGRFPPRALGLLLEWALLHQGELRENWKRANNKEPLVAIPPLE